MAAPTESVASNAVPIIVITGNTSAPIAAQCLKAGAFGYVPKPCNLVYLQHLAAASGLS